MPTPHRSSDNRSDNRDLLTSSPTGGGNGTESASPQMAVFSADLRGEFIACNSAFHELLGYSLLEVLGRDFSALFAETEKSGGGNHEGLRRTILAATSVEGDYRGNLFARPKNGNSFPVQFSATLLREPAGKPVALVAVIVPASEANSEANVTGGKAAASVLTPAAPVAA
ncbi:MAG: PAS domain-containing protein, partial [Candidatus Sulfotelmatobacter sp.]